LKWAQSQVNKNPRHSKLPVLIRHCCD
jgi:hypothetical protein